MERRGEGEGPPHGEITQERKEKGERRGVALPRTEKGTEAQARFNARLVSSRTLHS